MFSCSEWMTPIKSFAVCLNSNTEFLPEFRQEFSYWIQLLNSSYLIITMMAVDSQLTQGVCRINFGEVRTLKKRGGWRGLTPWKLIIFDPFVNSIVVILVNFLYFINFCLLFSQSLFRLAFYPCIHAWTHPVNDWHYYLLPSYIYWDLQLMSTDCVLHEVPPVMTNNSKAVYKIKIINNCKTSWIYWALSLFTS